MHLDGLADTADGLSATGDTASRLAAMKASDVGPSGVAALVLVLLLQVAASSTLLFSTASAALAGVAWVSSRLALAWCCRRGIPAATSGGLGALVAGAVPLGAVVASTCGLVLLAAVVPWAAGTTWWSGPVVLAAAVLAALALCARCTRRFGGVTGDVLGAVVETALAAGLVASVLSLSCC
jgi:adenosylcobinamide-GDP ribazoletransferase